MESISISKIVPLTESVQSFLLDYQSTNDGLSFKTIGGIFSNSKYVWYANGPRFEVVESRTGRKVASWTFGSILKDTATKVVCVSEIPCLVRETPLLVIGLECALNIGILCIFDILTSKILRTIQVDEKVSYLHVIDCGSNIFPILGPLKAFDGVVAVGLVGGNVLLIDLCQQWIDDAKVSSTEDIKGEVEPCQITSLTIKDINAIEDHKQRATLLGNHLSIVLNAVLDRKSPHFILKGPKGEDRVHVNKIEVLVTSLFYSSQLGSLLVGYNFGAWQLWNIISMTLVYTSPVYEENIPVSHFTVQEPTDDPRAFCYVWAVYSNTEENNVGFPIAVLYSLNYEVKDFHEGYGYLYQDLHSCAVRFQTELTAVGDKSKSIKSARCLRLTAFNRGCSSRASIQESHEDTLTICSMVWNVWHEKGVDTYMSIFDLNQWYKEQMPSSPQQNCFSYLSYICVTDILNECSNNSTVVDVLIDEASINQFIGIQKPEEHFYPTTLAYEYCACSDKNIVFSCNKGQQRALLGCFDANGPLILLKPKEIYQQSIRLGLTPLFVDPVQSDLNLQREFLLNIALEQQMLGFLCKCVSTWSNGSFAGAGCSLEFFVNWAWNRAVVLKTNADKLCESLFDYSDVSLDANNRRILNNCASQISNLHRVYDFICNKLRLPLPSLNVVRQQENCLHMIVTYLEVLQWLMNIGLLPEFSEDSTKIFNRAESICAPYPIESLLEYYRKRRSSVVTKSPFLYIDDFIENEFGSDLQRFWKDDGGDGYYPPPSLQSLLRTYLIENVDIVHKHCLIIYLFLDLAMALDQSRFKFIITNLIKFPTVFRINPSVTKITQAFWQLDHGDFATAMDQSLDPLINELDLKVWHHRTILNALFLQEQYNFALLYFQVRKPPLETTQDVLNILSLYVMNHMIDEAINFCRMHASHENETELIRHVLQECKRTDQILEFVYYPLNQKEEEVLMKYLDDISYEHFEEFRVFYYLHRSRYIDIYQMRNQDRLHPSGLQSQKEMGICDSTMKAITNYFPKVTRDILNMCEVYEKNIRNEISRPKPMSVFVHNAEEKAKYKSTLISAGIHKARETWTHPILDKSINESLPFIKTPTASLTGLRKRTSMICSKIINIEDGSAPEKRRKLNEEDSFVDSGNISDRNAPSLLNMSKLLTPIIKRRDHRGADFSKVANEKVDICTPQSILKVRNLVISQSPTTAAIHQPLVTSKSASTPSSTPIGVLGLTPRKSLSRSGVRFEKINESYLTDSSEMVKTTDDTNISNQNSKSSEMKSSPSIEAFYSPNTSGNDNEDDQSVTKSIKKVEHSSFINVENSQAIRDTVVKVVESDQELKRVSPKSRATYRDSHSRLENVATKSQEDTEKITKNIVIDEIETTPRRQRRSSRAKSQELEVQIPVLLSPRRSSLRISQRRSVSKLVSEDHGFTPLHSQHSTQSLVADVSAVSSLASEDFDAVIKNQSFSIPHISLSPTRCSTCIDTDDSTDKVILEETTEKSVNMVETQEQLLTEKQLRRSSFTVKARKSLSRMVLERNLGTMYTSTPHHSFVEETGTESMSSSNNVSSHIPGTSELSLSEQQELDRLISNQNFDIPNFSLSLDKYSDDSSITQEERSAMSDRNKSNDADPGNASKSGQNQTDADLLSSNKSSRRLFGRISFRKKDTSSKEQVDKLQIEETKDVIDPVTEDVRLHPHLPPPETTNKQLEMVQVVDISQDKHVHTVTRNLQIQQDMSVARNTTLHQHFSKTESPDIQFEEEQQADAGSLSENTETSSNHISSSIIADRKDVTNPNDLNNAQLLDTNVIEIPDSSSSTSNEGTVESDKSLKYSIIDEQEVEQCSASAGNSDSEISSIESSNDVNDTSGEFEEANNAFLQIQTNMELEGQYVTEVLVRDSSDEMENMEVELENATYTDVIEEILVTETIEPNQDVESEETQIAVSNIESTSPREMEICTQNKDLKEHENISSEDETTQLGVSHNVVLYRQPPKIDQSNSNEPECIRTLDLENITFIADELEPELDNDGCKTKDDTSSYPHSDLQNLRTEAIAVEEIVVKGDIINIEKGACDNILNTNSLDNSLSYHSSSKIDVDSKHQLALNKVPESRDLTEIKEHVSSKDDGKFAIDPQPIEHSHKMQLRTRRLSNTSIESPQKRTPRKRSVSVDEIINREQASMQQASPLKPKAFQVKGSAPEIQNIQNKPRSLRNRRAASVSDISDANIEVASSKRKNKRTTSVSNLPIISEESTKINEESSKAKIRDESSQVDEFEKYSTSRRLTRNQKHLLERSKGKRSTLGKIPETIATSVEVDSNDDQHAEASLNASESKGRVKTRRMSQESTSSLISTGNSTSDASSPPKRKRSSQKLQSNSPLPQTSMLRRGRSRSIDEVSVTSQISKSSRTTRQSDISDSGDQTTVSLRRSTRNRSKTPDADVGSKGSNRDKKVLSKIPEEADDESRELHTKRSKSKKK